MFRVSCEVPIVVALETIPTSDCYRGKQRRRVGWVVPYDWIIVEQTKNIMFWSCKTNLISIQPIRYYVSLTFHILLYVRVVALLGFYCHTSYT